MSSTQDFLRQAAVYMPDLKTNWKLDRVAFFGSADIPSLKTL